MTELFEAGAPRSAIARPPQHIIDLAVQVAGWSSCQSKRGVVIFHGDDVLANGCNVKPRGFDCDGSDACKSTCRTEAVHAEQVALLAASTKAFEADLLHVKAVHGQLVPSGGPSCVQCSKLALVAGIAGVWLYHKSGWHRYDAKEFHALSLRACAEARPSTDKGEEKNDDQARSGNQADRDRLQSSAPTEGAVGTPAPTEPTWEAIRLLVAQLRAAKCEYQGDDFSNFDFYDVDQVKAIADKLDVLAPPRAEALAPHPQQSEKEKTDLSRVHVGDSSETSPSFRCGGLAGDR